MIEDHPFSIADSPKVAQLVRRKISVCKELDTFSTEVEDTIYMLMKNAKYMILTNDKLKLEYADIVESEIHTLIKNIGVLKDRVAQGEYQGDYLKGFKKMIMTLNNGNYNILSEYLYFALIDPTHSIDKWIITINMKYNKTK